jgi:hypothetical protein
VYAEEVMAAEVVAAEVMAAEVVAAEVMAAEVDTEQVELIDAMLSDAYATVYKFIAKNIVYKRVGHEFKGTEESLLAKNVVTNLWSVLDYCCFTLYCSVCDKPPTPKIGRRLGFPNCDDKSKLTTWAKRLNLVNNLSRFVTVFNELQLQNTNSDAINFHRLHYLRNAYTHRTVRVIPTPELNEETVESRELQKYVNTSAIHLKVKVPAEPWKDESQETVTISMLDFLMDACKKVKEIRDAILSGELRQQRFDEKFEFAMTATEFTSKKNKAFKKKLEHLHLRCYGLDGDFGNTVDDA